MNVAHVEQLLADNPPPTKRPRDSQRRKLYDAEAAAFAALEIPMWVHAHQGEPGLPELSDVAEFIAETLDAVAHIFGEIDQPPQITGKGRTHAAAYQSGRLDFPKTSRTKPTVLHELAHYIDMWEAGWSTGNDPCRFPRGIVRTEGHGADFCGIYLVLVDTMLGDDAAAELHERMKAGKLRVNGDVEAGVRWGWRHPLWIAQPNVFEATEAEVAPDPEPEIEMIPDPVEALDGVAMITTEKKAKVTGRFDDLFRYFEGERKRYAEQLEQPHYSQALQEQAAEYVRLIGGLLCLKRNAKAILGYADLVLAQAITDQVPGISEEEQARKAEAHKVRVRFARLCVASCVLHARDLESPSEPAATAETQPQPVSQPAKPTDPGQGTLDVAADWYHSNTVSKRTGSTIDLSHADRLGIERDGKPWVVACETHGESTRAKTLKQASKLRGTSDAWCPSCEAR